MITSNLTLMKAKEQKIIPFLQKHRKISNKLPDIPIELATVTGSTSKLWEIATIKVNNNQKIEAILVADLSVESFNMSLPQEWMKFKDNWCNIILIHMRFSRSFNYKTFYNLSTSIHI